MNDAVHVERRACKLIVSLWMPYPSPTSLELELAYQNLLRLSIRVEVDLKAKNSNIKDHNSQNEKTGVMHPQEVTVPSCHLDPEPAGRTAAAAPNLSATKSTAGEDPDKSNPNVTPDPSKAAATSESPEASAEP